jgi:hypothetical protein
MFVDGDALIKALNGQDGTIRVETERETIDVVVMGGSVSFTSTMKGVFSVELVNEALKGELS